MKPSNLNETLYACGILHNLFERMNETISQRWLDEVANENDEGENIAANGYVPPSAIRLREELANHFRYMPLDDDE